jgi:putative aldouronate transport system substrate-binding protein
MELATHQGPVVRADFLDEIGLTTETLPTTVSGWEEMLAKVRDSEKLKDVIPFFFAQMSNVTESPVILGAYGITQQFYNDNGTVKYGAIQPEYKEYLALMRSWYEKDLLDPEFSGNTGKLRDEKVTSDRVFSFIGSMGNSITRYTAMCRESNPEFKLIPMKYPTLNEGETPIVGQQGANFTGGGIALTSSCRDPELVLRFYDYFYSEEGHVFSNWGIEGETYEYNADGSLQYTDLIKNNPDGLSREQAMAKYTIWQSISPVYKLKDVLEQRDSLPEQIEGRKNWMACENKIIMLPVTPTSEEANEFATIMNDCTTYTYEQATKIIMGNVGLDEGYDSMVSTLKSMGIERAIELRQAQLGRYLARK